MLPHRRHALFTFANGFGLIGLANLLAEQSRAMSDHVMDPLAVRQPHHAAKAKRLIFLFMSGGPSHVDLFDPKPKLKEFAGKPLPFEQPKLVRQLRGHRAGISPRLGERAEHPQHPRLAVALDVDPCHQAVAEEERKHVITV